MTLDFRRIAELPTESTQWLWPQRIPLGAITDLMGEPGEGKTTLNCHIAACVTTGQPLPGTAAAIPASDVLMLQPEDHASILKQNLVASGADLSRVHIATDAGGRFPEDIDEIERTVARTGAKLVIIDPITAYVRASQNESAVRCVTSRLSAMAAQHGCAVVLVRHLRKTTGTVMQRGLGSIAFAAAARSAICVVAHPADPGQRILVHYKSNLAPKAPSLSFVPHVRDGGLAIDWLGESDYSDQDFSAGSCEAPALVAARRFIDSILADAKQVPAKQLVELARVEGISESTLKRAKKQLGVRSSRRGFGRGSTVYWELPENSAVEPVFRQEIGELTDESCHGSPLGGISGPRVEAAVFTSRAALPSLATNALKSTTIRN